MQIDKVFTDKEIIKLQKLADHLPSRHEPNENINKNLHYQIPISPFRALIEPKVKKIIGQDAVVSGSSYKECIHPYQLHFDTQTALDYYNRNDVEYQLFNTGTSRYNLVFLIPLVEGHEFKTAIFDVDDSLQKYSDGGSSLKLEWCESTNNLDINDYDHLPEEDLKNINKLSLIDEFTWKLGSVIIWDRNKLHCSSNFTKHNLIKKMIVLFIE
jgi:hypothetical protein